MLVNDSCRTKTTFKGKIVFLFYDSLSPFYVNRVSRISCPVSGVELCYKGYQDTIQLKPAVTNIPMTPKTTMQTATNPIGTAWPFTNIQPVVACPVQLLIRLSTALFLCFFDGSSQVLLTKLK